MDALTTDSIRMIVVQMIVLLLSICVHEWGHAFVADKLGDRLPRSQGRVTLNPMAHADPLGTLMFPLFGLLLTGGASPGFGWGKPVQVNPTSFTRRFNVRTSHMFVAAAGPAMNIIFGTAILLVTVILARFEVFTGDHYELIRGIERAIQMNFILAFFNLIPAPPLDGGTVLAGLLPRRALPAYEQYAKYGVFVLFAAIIPGSPLKILFVWPAMQLYSFLVGIFGA
jgi:Zn-dependent protease